MRHHDDTARCVEELRTALRAHGITLPSLGIDPPTLASGYVPAPLVALGNCNLDTARALVAVLRGAGES